MKKLKLSLLDMKGTEMLNREQLKTVMGGTGYPDEGTTLCWFHAYDEHGDLYEPVYGLLMPGCPSASGYANQHCVNRIVTHGSGVYRCTYNCGC